VLTPDEIAQLCTAGAAAPSGGNTQPWRVTVTGGHLVIEVDRQRGDDSFLDVDGYAARFAIGCFAANVAIAARSLGLRYQRVVRDATVEFTFDGRTSASAHELYPYVPKRVTNRRASDGTRLAEPDVRRLVEVVTAVDPAFTVTAVSAPDRRDVVARALARADAVRMRNRAMFADMVREICWSGGEARTRRDGLDLPTLELPASTVTLLRVLRRLPRLRTVLPAARLGDTARALVRNCSHICCLSAAAPLTGEVMVAAGTAMQRLWLEATRHDVAVHPWTVSTLLLARLEACAGVGFTAGERAEVARIGHDLRDGFDLSTRDSPVFVFRLSKAQPPTGRSLRLPWQSFTTIAGVSHEPRG
jgi:nitroreductase